MHTSSLVSVIADPKFPDISVSTIQFYKDGVPVGVPDIERGLNTESLKTYCREKIEQLDADVAELQSMKDFISTHTVGPVDIAPPPLSPEDVKKQAFQESLQKVRDLKKQIDLGIIEDTDDEYVEAIQTAKEAKGNI